MSHVPHPLPADVAATSASRPTLTLVPPVPDRHPTSGGPREDDGEDGSLVAEYGLLAVVAATITAALTVWGRTALPEFFTTLLDHARTIVT